MCTHRLLEGFKQSHVILARLQVAYGKHEWSPQSELLFDPRPRQPPLDRAKLRGNSIMRHHDLARINAVVLQDRVSRKFARRQDRRGPLHCPFHCEPELRASISGEIFREFQETYVMHAYY